MNNELYQLLLSMKIGDGCYVTQRIGLEKTYRVQTNSTKEDYLRHKEMVLNKYGLSTRKITCVSGYKSTSNIVGFTTHVADETTTVGNMSKTDVIRELDVHGLIYYYLDDGSLHNKKHYMNIYCCSFSDDEAMELIHRIYDLFPQKRCSLLHDNKKDGRVFPYIYVPTVVAIEISASVREFLIDNNISSLLYKTISPSQTIERK